MRSTTFFFLALSLQCSFALERPNIILIFADDISARELPIYGSSVWSKPERGNTSDPKHLAKTPALDKMAAEGCAIKTAWASVVCSPSRAMMMTGRYAHLHKWWNNKDVGTWISPEGKKAKWPLYESSPKLIGHIAQEAGYGTYWVGKTQMPADLTRYGFDEGCFTPGNLADKDNPHTDFKLVQKKVDGEKLVFNKDTGRQEDTYLQHGWYWYPHIRLMNHEGKPGFQWWPNDEASKERFGLHTYGPDVELEFAFKFMERKQKEDQPFFIYHTTHLGHDAFDWFDPDSPSSWPGTPKVSWNGERYTRTAPKITGDNGVYDTHGTVTEPGMHSHVEYLDYQVWLYRNKLKEMGIDKNTVLIFCADNGTGGYGKNSSDRQKGTHVPLFIHAPGMTKHGMQDVLVNMSDFLPTIAELAGVEIPSDYPHNGKSLVPFLFTAEPEHRDWIYGYSKGDTIIRGRKVLKDGRGKWWDVSSTPDDLISFKQIQDWKVMPQAFRNERNKLKKILPEFDRHATEHDAPTVGWKDLFDGESLEGWRGYQKEGIPASWEVRDGSIFCNGKDDAHLVTEEKYGDFELIGEWKISKAGNSGILLRVKEVTPWPATSGLVVQVIDHTDGWKEVHGSGLGLGQGAGALYGLYPAKKAAIKKSGKWNTLRVLVDGTKIALWQNGIQIVDADMDSNDWKSRLAKSKFAKSEHFNKSSAGHIALQNYRGAGVWFRNLRIWEIGGSQ